MKNLDGQIATWAGVFTILSGLLSFGFLFGLQVSVRFLWWFLYVSAVVAVVSTMVWIVRNWGRPNYTQDTLYGRRWQWSWKWIRSAGWVPVDFQPFCNNRTCGKPLPLPPPTDAAGLSATLRCAACGAEIVLLPPYAQSLEYLSNDVLKNWEAKRRRRRDLRTC